MFIVWNPREFCRLYNVYPWYCNSLLCSLIYSGENSGHFLQLIPFTIFHLFVPPGTHYCWVGRGSMEWEVCLTLQQMTSSGNQTSDLLFLSNLKYYALSTWSHAPIVLVTYCKVYKLKKTPYNLFCCVRSHLYELVLWMNSKYTGKCLETYIF